MVIRVEESLYRKLQELALYAGYLGMPNERNSKDAVDLIAELCSDPQINRFRDRAMQDLVARNSGNVSFVEFVKAA